MTEPTREQQLARLYRMLFMYETDPAAEWAPVYLSTMGQEDCRWAIRRLEAEIAIAGRRQIVVAWACK